MQYGGPNSATASQSQMKNPCAASVIFTAPFVDSPIRKCCQYGNNEFSKQGIHSYRDWTGCDSLNKGIARRWKE
jgi:hypothetical protein